MSENPLVSVIIPTYSRPTFLDRCIGSVLNQTYKNIEIIVVDDNDPDTKERYETEQVMEKYADNSVITYIRHTKNKNGSAARNTGWKIATGEYITFLDDDDEILDTKLEKQVSCLENLDSSWGACYTGYKLIKEYGEDQFSSEKRSGNCYVDALMRTMFMGSGSNLFLRKSVVDSISGYDESFVRNQDIEFLVRVTEKYKIAHIDETLLIIYQEGKRKKRTFEELEKITKYYLDVFSDRINSLPVKEKERVIAVISLERFRQSLYNKSLLKGLRILKENKISPKYIFRYLRYLLRRIITKESYGFRGF